MSWTLLSIAPTKGIPDDFLSELSASLKASGYRKRRFTWIKNGNGVVVLFSIEKSQFGSDDWYYYFGIGINALSDRPIGSISKCHLLHRIEKLSNGHLWTADDLIHLISRWENMYGNITILTKRAVEGQLPQMTSTRAIRYLTSVDPSKLH